MSTPSTSRQRWLWPVLIVVVSLTVGGGLLVRELYRQPDQEADAAVALPSTMTLRPDQQPGPPTVELTPDAAAHPEDERIRQLLQTYFDAINGRDYELWKTTVTRERLAGKSQSQWLADYRTTRDGSMVVYRIETAPERHLRVLVGFTSTQDAGAAPPELAEPCLRWKLSLPVVMEGGSWKVDTVLAGTTPELDKC